MKKDIFLNEMLHKKEKPQLPEGLEEKIMTKIGIVANQIPVNRKYLYLIWIFFVIGMVAGILISTIWVNRDTGFFGLNFPNYKLFIQLFCSVVILLLFEKIYRLSVFIKKRRTF